MALQDIEDIMRTVHNPALVKNRINVDTDFPKIKEYVAASGTPWIISSPVEIDNNIYTDGGLLQLYPIEYVDESTADLKVIVGYDDAHFYKYAEEGDNVLYYLARIIDICRINNLNMKYIKKVSQQKNVVLIDNPIKVDFLKFEPNIIKDGFCLGEAAAVKFALNYFNLKKESHLIDNINKKKLPIKKNKSTANLLGLCQ